MQSKMDWRTSLKTSKERLVANHVHGVDLKSAYFALTYAFLFYLGINSEYIIFKFT